MYPPNNLRNKILYIWLKQNIINIVETPGISLPVSILPFHTPPRVTTIINSSAYFYIHTIHYIHIIHTHIHMYVFVCWYLQIVYIIFHILKFYTNHIILYIFCNLLSILIYLIRFIHINTDNSNWIIFTLI